MEFTLVSITAVYVPPSADTDSPVENFHCLFNELQSTHTEGFFIVAGDFNQATIKSILPHFHQLLDWTTRGVNTLDMAYIKSSPLPSS